MEGIKSWIPHMETGSHSQQDQEKWSDLIESVAVTLVSFNLEPNSPNVKPLERLRGRFIPDSQGAVITTGKQRFRYACHLILSLRQVLKSNLPIQIAYSGEDDLRPDYREFITRRAPNVSAFDVTAVFDDRTLDLPHGGWAIKAFAVLGSTFEQAILLDADDVFFQPPFAIFDQHPQYLERGVLLYSRSPPLAGRLSGKACMLGEGAGEYNT